MQIRQCRVKVMSVQTFNRTRNTVLLPIYLFSWTVATCRVWKNVFIGLQIEKYMRGNYSIELRMSDNTVHFDITCILNRN